MSQPEGAHFTTTSLKFTTDDPPHEVIGLLIEVADSLPMKAPGERASAVYSGAGAYSVTLPVLGPSVAAQAMSLYLAWLWYAARRRGLALDGDATDPIAEPGQLERALEIVGPTLHAGDAEREMLLATSRLERYGMGEVVQAAGVVPSEIRFIVDGAVRVAVEAGGGRIDFSTAEVGDYIGQTALTREPTLTVAVAAAVTTVLVVPLETLDELVRSRPLLAREIGESIELKRKLAAEALGTAGIVRGTLGGG
jgi:hypothetical protein